MIMTNCIMTKMLAATNAMLTGPCKCTFMAALAARIAHAATWKLMVPQGTYRACFNWNMKDATTRKQPQTPSTIDVVWSFCILKSKTKKNQPAR